MWRVVGRSPRALFVAGRGYPTHLGSRVVAREIPSTGTVTLTRDSSRVVSSLLLPGKDAAVQDASAPVDARTRPRQGRTLLVGGEPPRGTVAHPPEA